MSINTYGEYIQFDFGSAKQISMYGLGNWGADKQIGTWTLAGSNDLSTWYAIDNQTQYTTAHFDYSTFMPNGGAASTSYRYIRFIVQGLLDQPYINGTTLEFIMYLKDQSNTFLQQTSTSLSAGLTGTAQGGNPTIRLGTSASDTSRVNSPGSGPSQPGYYYGTNNTYTGSVYTPVTFIAPTVTYILGETVTFDIGSSQILGSYGYCANGYPNYLLPKFWTMVGSNNNSTWYSVDTQTNGHNGSGDARSFTPSGDASSIAFRYYRYILRGVYNSTALYIGGFFLKNTSGNVITASVIQNNIVSTYHGGGFANFAFYINRTTFAGGNEDIIPHYTPLYNGSNNTTVQLGLPDGPPSKPTSLSPESLDQSLSISFTPGTANGSSITNYKFSIDGGATYTAFSPAQTTSPVVISGLTNAVSYNIKIRAVNGFGDGQESNLVTGTPSTIPDAPTNLIASYGGANGSVSISFTAGFNEGRAITNYQYSIDGGSSFTPFSPVDNLTPVLITGLTIGTYYVIELKAVNSNGPGIASSSIGYTASGLPEAPTNLSWVDKYNGTIEVSFTPGYNNASAITNYQYSLDDGSTFTALSPVDSLTPITISGLTNRTNYTLVIRAVNANGVGASSASLALYYMCFLEGTKITCYDPIEQKEVDRAIESLNKGDLVKTTMDGYKAIDSIGTSKIYNPANSMRSKNRLYRCSKENYPELNEDLVITGCHAVLVKELTEKQRTDLIEIQGKIYTTEDYYRLIACVDQRAIPYEKEGLFNIWHLALENNNYYYNYGIFANGLKVETASKRMMREMSGMDLK